MPHEENPGQNNPGNPGPDKFIPPSKERMDLIAHLANVQSIRINSFRPFVEKTTGAITNATTQNLDFQFKTTKSLLFVVTQFSARNKTSDTTIIELSLFRGKEEYGLNADAPSELKVSVDFAGQAIFAKGDIARAKFVGTTSADVIEASIHGYTIEDR